jgi:hypothetical protein
MKNKSFTVLSILALALMMVVAGCDHDPDDTEKTFSIVIQNASPSPYLITKITVKDIHNAVLAEKTTDVPTGRNSVEIFGTFDNGEYVIVQVAVWASAHYQTVATGSEDVPTRQTKMLTLKIDKTDFPQTFTLTDG